MKKSSLILVAALLMLPLGILAQNKPKIKSVDLTLPIPTPGMSRYDAQELKFTSAKTEYGDLAPTGGIVVYALDWVGDFRETDDGEMYFKDGFTYKARLQFMVDSGRYDTDYVFKNNDYSIDGSRISATVNGIKATVLQSPPYFIKVEFSIPVGKGGKGSEKELAQSKPTDYELNKNSYRASQKAYSIAEADAACPDVSPLDVITVNDTYQPKFGANDKRCEFCGHKNMLVTKIIVDTDDEEYYQGVGIDVLNYIQGPYNIREVWLSDKVDPEKFIRSMYTQMQGGYDPKTSIFTPVYSFLFYSRRATLFIPEPELDKVFKLFSNVRFSYPILFTLKTYTGDVYSAQKAGADAAKDVCTNHVFTDKVASADKIYRYATCSNGLEYYYSCHICGKCEYNPKHVFCTDEAPYGAYAHSYTEKLADDEAYIGENSAGQHVWWCSCQWCGHADGYHRKHITKGYWKISGNAASYDEYCKGVLKMTEGYEDEVLLSTSEMPDVFILKRKSSAKMSPKFQSSVNFALNDNLLDDSVLGNDYTLPLNYAQMRSLIENLVKELTQKEPKASALALNKVLGGKTPADGSPVTRQEMAALMYRALRYIEECRVYAYTEYDPALEKYADCGSIAPWAKEAMAFMEALELIKPTSDGMLSPEKTCTIEEAIEFTEKCTTAHQLGWYQARCWGEGVGRFYNGNVHEFPEGSINQTYAHGERIWVIGPRIGVSSQYLPIREKFTGTRQYVKAEWFRPIRKNVFTDKRTLTGPVIFIDYFCGAPTH